MINRIKAGRNLWPWSEEEIIFRVAEAPRTMTAINLTLTTKAISLESPIK